MSCLPVTIVGAGPGAVDLITLRGRAALEQADAVLYAGSLVNPELLTFCQQHCLCRDSAAMPLAEQIDFMAQAALAGKKVVRLHTGDPALYGAINEQITLLAERGVPVLLVPGVSSVFGAAAALGCELTSPEVSQSVVLTRTAGRTPMPAGESAAAFARTGATLVFFLSTGKVAALMDELQQQGGLAPSTPAAAVYRATWPDERIVRGTLADLAQGIEAAGFRRQALIFVGQALAQQPVQAASHLYAAQFSHGYRNNLAAEAFYGRCALYACTPAGLARAHELCTGLGLECHIFSTNLTESTAQCTALAAGGLVAAVAQAWPQYDAHIFLCATGIAVRAVSPLLQNKAHDPAVLACAESGAFCISLVSGHLGGANRLAQRVARITGGQALISTATDGRHLPAFDAVAALEQARVLNPQALRRSNAALLAGEDIDFCGDRALFEQHFSSVQHIHFVEQPEQCTASVAVLWDAPAKPCPAATVLRICSAAFVLGTGCRAAVPPAVFAASALAFLAQHKLKPAHIACLASCDRKQHEPALLALAQAWNIPFVCYAAEQLATVPVPHPSATVQEKVGTPSVSEAAALLAAGYPQCSRLHAAKTKDGGVTFALARIAHGQAAESALAAQQGTAQPAKEQAAQRHGAVLVASLGSGMAGHITPEVDAALAACDTVAGYTPYVDFIRQRVQGKDIIQNGMMGEVERCRATLEAAAKGRQVCMVCSGDAGILAMAGLLYELRASEAAFSTIPIRVLPGITAANIAAASLGAPLQNGYCLVSLSDLLVPTEEVRANIQAVAQAALPVALYNPAGKKRRQLLQEALTIFRAVRGQACLCALVRHAGRPQEEKWIGTLAELPETQVDMSSLLLIGGARTVREGDVLFEKRGYADKYAGKHGLPTQGTKNHA